MPDCRVAAVLSAHCHLRFRTTVRGGVPCWDSLFINLRSPLWVPLCSTEGHVVVEALAVDGDVEAVVIAVAADEG